MTYRAIAELRKVHRAFLLADYYVFRDYSVLVASARRCCCCCRGRLERRWI